MNPNRSRFAAGIYRFRGPLLVLAVLLVTASTAAALSAFGDSGIEEYASPRGGVSDQRVRTDGERCAVPLLDGWTWRPAAWSLISPNGTILGLYETLHGRPQYTEWEETIAEMLDRHAGREGVEIIQEDDMLRLDFGENGGLSVIMRFDRVGCHLTFSPPSSEVRAQEIDQWELLIDSVERVYPQD